MSDSRELHGWTNSLVPSWLRALARPERAHGCYRSLVTVVMCGAASAARLAALRGIGHVQPSGIVQACCPPRVCGLAVTVCDAPPAMRVGRPAVTRTARRGCPLSGTLRVHPSAQRGALLRGGSQRPMDLGLPVCVVLPLWAVLTVTVQLKSRPNLADDSARSSQRRPCAPVHRLRHPPPAGSAAAPSPSLRTAKTRGADLAD